MIIFLKLPPSLSSNFSLSNFLSLSIFFSPFLNIYFLGLNISDDYLEAELKKIENNSNAFPKINLLNSNNSLRDPGSSQIMKPLHPLKTLLYLKLLNVRDRPDILWKMLPNTDEHIKV